MTIASPTATSVTVIAMVKSVEHPPRHRAVEVREGDQVDVDGVQHELEAEEDADGVPPREHPEEPDREHRGGEEEVGGQHGRRAPGRDAGLRGTGLTAS